MSLSGKFVQGFVNAFGITQPAPEQEARMALYIGGGILVVLVALGFGAFLLFRMLAG